MDLAMTDLWRATREKQTKAHDILDQALRDKGQDCTVFTVPQGVLYRPAESKVKNSKKKDYLGNSKVIAAVDAKDEFAGFKGMSAWQVQMSGPTNVAAVDEPRPMTPPNGLQRRATERNLQGAGSAAGAGAGRPVLEHSASFSGMDRRGPGPSNLGPAGSEPSGRPTMLARRNTERLSPLNTEVGGINGRGGPSSGQTSTGRSRFQDELDEIEQHVNALGLEAERDRRGRGSPGPARSNSRSNSRSNVKRTPSLSSRTSPTGSNLSGGQPVPPMPNISNYNMNPPMPGMNGRASPANSPALGDIRRMPSNGRGLARGDSIRSTASSAGMFRSLPLQTVGYNGSSAGSVTGRSDDTDEPVYAGLRDKIRVKCHYIDTRAVLVRPDTPIQELIQQVQKKFQSDRPLKLKYKDEDQHMLSMIDDEDWLMAQQVHRETTGSLDRIELWCFDDD
ncbi:hypothetical protein BGZ80_006780 [Entomortierella chlamydospora]|uniref:PB1 domain-containing protein n=1 Tax=Entomortierella chlamydospora TaxID=101097 RepID=A0A9P6MGB8_9FUNG|nr:hypothetical protein BGZ79_002369 [Entomortierella chlamydospora]KAF9998456.1 hypothetical protein BGZ80_006780 [Entomortierella chlamydospora]